MEIYDRWTHIHNRIRQACIRVDRNPDDVTVLAVTKNADDAAVAAARDLGILHMGENRIQQARRRRQAFPDIHWHFIGTLQTNKVKYCRDFALIHSLDRWRLAEALNRQAERWKTPIAVLVQVNPGGEEQKHGLATDEARRFVHQVAAECPHLTVRGLMSMAPFVEDPETVRPVFRWVKQLQSQLQADGFEVPVLSMGMTNDYEVAVEEGATLVRIGSALFREEV